MMRGRLRWLVVVLGVILAGFVTQRVVGDTTAHPHLVSSEPVAVIGSGSSAVPVAEDGTVLAWLQLPESVLLPQLSLAVPPKGPRVQGPALEQVRVLAAAPAELQPYVAASRIGPSGVDVELSSGIELRFGDAAAAGRKWRAAAALLANPEVTSLDYVDLHAPQHPSIGGSGHTLPPVP
jgi:cell division septal protein FtsQ